MITHTVEYIYSFRSNIVGSVDSVMIDAINSSTIKSYTAFKVSHAKNNFMFRNIELSDEEIIKKLNGLLNKITKTNFNKIFDKINSILKSEEIVDKMMDKVFDKAIKQTNFCEIYAEICARFVNNEKEVVLANSMKDSLLRKCEEMYVECLNEDEHEKTNLKNYDEFCEYMKNKRKLIGCFQFMGNLYKKNLCEEKDISNYVKLLMNKIQYYRIMETGKEEQKELLENLCECLCKLLQTLNESIALFKKLYYDDIHSFTQDTTNFSARVRFMFLDLVEFFQKYEENSNRSFSSNNNKYYKNSDKNGYRQNDNRFNNRKKGFNGGKYDKKKKYNGRRKKYFDKKDRGSKDGGYVQNNNTGVVSNGDNNYGKKSNSFSNRNNKVNYRKRRDYRKTSGNKDNNFGSKSGSNYNKTSGNKDNNYNRDNNYNKKKNYPRSNYQNSNSYSQNTNDDSEDNLSRNKKNHHKNKRFEILNSKD